MVFCSPNFRLHTDLRYNRTWLGQDVRHITCRVIYICNKIAKMMKKMNDNDMDTIVNSDITFHRKFFFSKWLRPHQVQPCKYCYWVAIADNG